MRYATGDITAVVMMLFTASVLAGRYRLRPDTNLSLIYFLVVFGYYFNVRSSLNPQALYAGVVSALFLRFEFMSGWLRWFLQGAETVVMVYLGWSFYDRVWY